jgi:MFS transporter, DHA1 family, multidrug resistance protein
MVALVAYLFGIGMPETYGREIIRARARRAGKPHNLPKALSGETFAEMAKLTVVDPVIMLFSEPIVIGSTLYVSFLFGTIFQWFIAVPVVLKLTYGFSIGQAGLAFIAALGGAFLATATCVALDRLAYPRAVKKSAREGKVDIEYRLLPAMFGTICMTVSFFWIAWTARPTISYYSPIIGTGLYVYGRTAPTMLRR